MVSRKRRVRVVLDTNVFVRALLSRSKSSANQRVLRIWLLERELQLIVSTELMDEYLEIFSKVLGMNDDLIAEWRQRFTDDGRSTLVNLGTRYPLSRDPDDNMVLATAAAGDARYLVTNDRDLLELPEGSNRLLPFAVMTPRQFLEDFDDQ